MLLSPSSWLRPCAQSLLASFSREECLRAAGLYQPPLIDQLRQNPSLPMERMGMRPDPWQRDLILSEAREITVLCTRRAGKSRAVATRVLSKCLTRPNYLAMVFSPTQYQSMEFLDYVRQMNAAMGQPYKLLRDARREMAWANGSRAVSFADSTKGAVGFTPNMLVIDEGAKVSDELYNSVRPMLALGDCEMLTISTPFGKRGWFFDIWGDPDKLAEWESFCITAEKCPRISPEFLRRELLTVGERWFGQEYLCKFNDAVDAVFAQSVIDQMFDNDLQPLFTTGA